MRQKVFIFFALILLAILLVGLNAASYVQKEKTPDNELSPNRSTYNAGATGTRALYELLAETGRKTVRWQEPPSALASLDDKNKPSTFVVVGKTRREFTDKEIEQLLQWVSLGGRLVVIDREPRADLIATTANWKISVDAPKPFAVDEIGDNNGAPDDKIFEINSSNQRQMTLKTAAAKPVQPTIFTAKVNAVQSSRLASGISFERFAEGTASTDKANNTGVVNNPPPPIAAPTPTVKATKSNEKNTTESVQESGIFSVPPPPASPNNLEAEDGEFIDSPALTAPSVHLSNGEKNLLVDFPFGSGQIVFLSDPYIVSNGGINLVDNAQVAVNILTAQNNSVIAFDEYHQGFGTNNNRFFEYFSGTPVLAIMVQFAILTGLIFFAQSRRFARPLPEAEPNRLSKLEYVSAMAQLQGRTRAYDLAIENIYTDFRRRAARSLGADNYAVSLPDLAKLISERIDSSADEIEKLMHGCEEIVRGERTNKKAVLEITKRLREIEEKLGLLRQKTARR